MLNKDLAMENGDTSWTQLKTMHRRMMHRKNYLKKL
jgi:hypothetical protein